MKPRVASVQRSALLWDGLPTVPPARPKVSASSDSPDVGRPAVEVVGGSGDSPTTAEAPPTTASRDASAAGRRGCARGLTASGSLAPCRPRSRMYGAQRRVQAQVVVRGGRGQAAGQQFLCQAVDVRFVPIH